VYGIEPLEFWVEVMEDMGSVGVAMAEALEE
jgi:hypothetical protein